MDMDQEKVEPSPQQPRAPVSAPPYWKKWVIPSLMVVVVILIAAAAIAAPKSTTPHPISTAVTPARVAHVVPTDAGSVHISPEGTLTHGETQNPTTAATTFPQTCVASGPPGFTVTVTPTDASAAHGETVIYHMTIEAQNCFSGPIHTELMASVLFFSETYDLGTQEPPYPKTVDYPFLVPDRLPSGVTVNGVIRSTGGGITREDQLTLSVK